MTHKTQPTAHAEITAPISADLRGIEQAHKCIRPQCDPAKCTGCICAIGPSDEAGQVVLSLLYVFAVNDLGHPFEDGDSAAVDRARQWLQNRSTAAVAVQAGFALVPKRLTRAMERVLLADEEGWQWEDLLSAAEAITEEEYAALAAAPAQAWPSECDSPELCQVHRGCAGQYGTKNTCPSFAALNRCNSATPAQAVAVPIELQGVKEAVEQGSVFWRSCTGCHELNEGHDTGPVSKVFGCALGNGCSECGGIGAVWDDTDYDAMADAMAAPAQEHATQLAGKGRDLGVTDEMALPFHRAISDGAIGQDDVDEIKDGLRAAFCNIAAPAQAQEDAPEGTLRFDLGPGDWFKVGVGSYPLYHCLDCNAYDYGPTRVTHKAGCRVDAAIAARAAQGGAA